MDLTPECLNDLFYRVFWENTKEPTLKKFLDFRLRSGDLEDMQTEHNNYKNELLTISSHYAKISEIGEKVKKWKLTFKACLYLPYWERLLVCWCAHLPMNGPRGLPFDLLVRKGKTACSSASAKKTKQIKIFWEMHEQKENINMKSKLLEEQYKLDLMQAQAEMTEVQVNGIVHTATQLNKGALSNLENIVSTIASVKSEMRNKRAKLVFIIFCILELHQSLHNSPDIVVDEEYNEIAECEYLKTQMIQESTHTTTNELREIINKVKNSTHRLFEYRIIDLSDRNAANPVNKIFTTSEKELLKDFWDTSEESCQFNTYDPKWEEIIKPLLNTYGGAFIEPKSMFDDVLMNLDIVMEKPYNGVFNYKQHYILLWVQDLYKRFILNFKAPLNKLTDSKQSEFSYREDFISPILARAFDDLDTIRFRTGEIENMLTKKQRNETEQQKSRIRLGYNQDGIIEVSLNATDLEIGFMEVVGSAIEIDFKKLGEDTEKVFKAMQISMFYQRLYFLQRGATEDKIKCIESYGIVVYQRVITIYTMHRIPEGIYIVDILMQFSIPEIKNDFYMIKELIEKIYFFKIRIMEYYTKMRAIIQNPSRTYIQTKELPTEASPSKTSKKIFEI
ncbi:16168_t:CDS:10 [Funneliformis caledonium]|uniref:16168_t:CDS:1 n=1 Tax=Funneliformis caledonium TaxID=1117310 RepID=A0A9N9EMU6_9GLOM|nr:16168_t:CDS:10 [Funneliformis caledonium]